VGEHTDPWSETRSERPVRVYMNSKWVRERERERDPPREREQCDKATKNPNTQRETHLPKAAKIKIRETKSINQIAPGSGQHLYIVT